MKGFFFYYLIRKVFIDIAALMLLMLSLIKLKIPNERDYLQNLIMINVFVFYQIPSRSLSFIFCIENPGWHCGQLWELRETHEGSARLTPNILLDSHLLRLTCRATSSSATLREKNKYKKSILFQISKLSEAKLSLAPRPIVLITAAVHIQDGVIRVI